MTHSSIVERLRDHGDNVTRYEAADRIEELEKALADMVDTFQPFSAKPMGAPNSTARAIQDHEIRIHRAARAALPPIPGEARAETERGK